MVSVKIPSYKMRGDMAILECEYELNGNSQRHYNGGGLHRKTTGTPFLSMYNNNNNNNDNNNDYEDSVEENTSDSNNNNRNYLRQQQQQSNDNNRFFNQQKQRQLYQNNNNARSRTKKKRYSNNYFSNGDYREADEDVNSSSSRHHSDSSSSLNSGSYNNNYEYPNKYSVQPKEALYSVKWYRDNEEFYRYVPKDNPPQNSYVVDGIKVDVSNQCCCCNVCFYLFALVSTRYEM